VLQKEPAEGWTRLDIIMRTHQTSEKNIDAAIQKIEAMETVVGSVTRIRLESLG
jgi:homoserine dehydrogenase